MTNNMANVTVKVKGYSSGLYKDETNINFDINASNIDQLKAAIEEYERETRLPETIADVYSLLRKQQKDNRGWYVDYDNCIEWRTQSIDSSRFFPAKWQAEKLHALACMEQVWISLHPEGFDWMQRGNEHSFIFLGWDGSVQMNQFTSQMNPFPFRTRELAEQAIKILGEETISKAFATK